LHYGDLTDGTGLRRVLERVNPDQVYNLGAQSHVKVSFDIPEYTTEVVAIGTLRLIEAVRDHVLHGGRPVRFYQAGSSEMFGAAPPPQSERTPFYPRSPYGVSKVAAHWFRSTTARLTGFSSATVFYSIMRVLVAVKLS
jgi:GDPmannose 4,6-dehydratase